MISQLNDPVIRIIGIRDIPATMVSNGRDGRDHVV